MKKSNLLLAAVTVFSVLGTAATPAFAGPVLPNGACGGGDFNYVDTSTGFAFTRASGTNASVSGDPGVTLSISTSTAFSVSGTIGATGQISESIVVLTVNQSLNVSITAGFTRTSTNSGSWTVPTDWTRGGRLEIGARKYSGVVSKYRANVKDCSNGAFISSAYYNAPDNSWFFQRTQL